jgi:uncharacterized circularly permuted ATP-grasp superfamily protein/uncharacterized alpha-E superfamily protein
MEQTSKTPTDRTMQLLNNYRMVEGVPDELMDQTGTVREVWSSFLNFFGALSPEDIEKRFAKGDQYLRDAGVFFRQYDDKGSIERDWPLSHIPVILEETEWQTITAGLIQRANLLEDIMADLYGANNLVANGHIPAELIAKSPEWLRPMIGTKPRSGHFLNLVAFEIGRGPDGQWWVLGDRTQAPSGAGFALENRVATTHVFPDHYSRANIHRLAGFFKRFRDTLHDLSNDQDCGVAILTPGRLTDTYFEHAYIARYLGFMLLEGEDITVRNGKAMVRTVAGLQPISVLWRRLDSSFVDPLELNEYSILGTPGLADAVRQGNLTMINALGSGVMENRAFLAFLPRICQEMRGEQLLLPNIATWWCGQNQERDHVLSKADTMMFGPALSTTLPFEQNEMFSLLNQQNSDVLRQNIMNSGSDYVAQETISLSTTPVYEEGILQARPMSIRVFMARTHTGWDILPGGYARIGDNKGTSVIAMQGGGQVADVWVSSPKRVERETMAPKTTGFVRAQPEVLPSRAADNLFWLGRYSERAEFTMRLSRAYHARLEESNNPDAALLKHFANYMENLSIEPDEVVPQVLCDTLVSAMGSAGHIRDRFSVDGWTALKDLSDTAWQFKENTQPGDDCARAMQILLRKISGFSGLVHESMYHYTGWRFMNIGRALERASLMASLLRYFTAPDSPSGALDIPVDVGDSVMTHQRRYVVTTNRETVIDLLALDTLNPRSILYQLTEFREHLDYLPQENKNAQMSKLAKAALKLHTELAIKSPETLRPSFLREIEKSIYELCDLLSTSYLK